MHHYSATLSFRTARAEPKTGYMNDDLVRGEVLYDDGRHKYVWLGWDEEEDDGLVQTNQYLIIHDGVGCLLDPGGVHVFPRVVSNLARYIDLKSIKHIFFSHQDPDVCSGLALWTGVTTAQVHVSKLWVRFLPHFGSVDPTRLTGIEDRGGKIPWGDGSSLRVVPTHFLHSVGNLSVFDPASRILFTGDLGAAIVPAGKYKPFVDDFRSHVQYMEGFHTRYLAGNAAARLWARMVRQLDPVMIAPQHGSIFRGSSVDKFLSWMEELRCGLDLIEEIYGVRA